MDKELVSESSLVGMCERKCLSKSQCASEVGWVYALVDNRKNDNTYCQLHLKLT